MALESLRQAFRRQQFDATLSIDDATVVIANERRRLTIDSLAETEGGVTALGELAEAVAAAEHEKPVAEIDSNERKSAYIALVQTHLPRLDGLDVVDYDEGAQMIERGPAFDHAERVLEAVRSEVDTPTEVDQR